MPLGIWPRRMWEELPVDKRFADPASPAGVGRQPAHRGPAFHPLGAVEAAGARAGLFRTSSRKCASCGWLERLFTLARIHPAPLNGVWPSSMRDGCMQYLSGLNAGGRTCRETA